MQALERCASDLVVARFGRGRGPYADRPSFSAEAQEAFEKKQAGKTARALSRARRAAAAAGGSSAERAAPKPSRTSPAAIPALVSLWFQLTRTHRHRGRVGLITTLRNLADLSSGLCLSQTKTSTPELAGTIDHLDPPASGRDTNEFRGRPRRNVRRHPIHLQA